MSGFLLIFDLLEPRVARVMIFDRGHASSMGRYMISKTMLLPNGKPRVTYAYRHQRPAAERYARRWVEGRKALSQQEVAS